MLELLVLLPIGLLLYAYLVYPLLLAVLAVAMRMFGMFRIFRHATPKPSPTLASVPTPAPDWPYVTVTVPCYNAERHIAATLEGILATDYPADRRQILVISDASTDTTDTVVAEFADRGVELLRLPVRQGKSAAESAALAHVRGAIVVNVDATIQLSPQSLTALVAAFTDPSVGIASGYDVSVRHLGARRPRTVTQATIARVPHADDRQQNTPIDTPQDVRAEGYYVGYEMNVRALETRVNSIIGASGCFYAVRRTLFDATLPFALTRDFAAVLHAYERGFRAVSVPTAICFVPRSASSNTELHRKARTMAGGLQTLLHFKHLLNPARSGLFAWMLFSHKLCRWLVYLVLPLSCVALLVKGVSSLRWTPLLAAVVAGSGAGLVGLYWPKHRRVPRLFSVAGYGLLTNVAGVLAWAQIFGRATPAVWEPTQR